jgi:chaperonin GroES
MNKKGDATMLKPLHNYVLLERIEETNKTAGGIIIPDTAKEKPSTGMVIAVGNGTKDEPMTVKAGDRVLFGKWASSANEVKLDGKDYILIKETDILGIISA